VTAIQTQTRDIVRIDEDKCDGCGLCVPDCAEGAIQIVDGKAKLVAENLCDGLGNCLGACPKGAITIEQRAADEFSEQAVAEHLTEQPEQAICEHSAEADPADQAADKLPCGCPGTMARKLNPEGASSQAGMRNSISRPSRLGQWPVQLSLLPPGGDIWHDADVLIAADCVGFAMPDFHERLLASKTLAIACPKLDDVQPYVEKLASIFANNSVRSLTVAHMEVPCCSGIVMAVREALKRSGRTDIPLLELKIGMDGSVVEESDAK
jgi:NAD-dependent dihydropyrimidine dehydrogenase PreA subunit